MIQTTNDKAATQLLGKERGQAKLRIGITFFLAIYYEFGGHGTLNYAQFRPFMALELLIALAILISFRISPKPSPVRRVVGMLCDYSCLAGGMSAGGQQMALIYPVFLLVTIGNGMRYGKRYLLAATVLATAALGFVVLSGPFWMEHLELSAALLSGIVLIPLYLSTLMKALHDALKNAERANQAKSQFLATMSHEVRTPLSAVLGMTELLATGDISNEQREHVQVIVASARALQMVVEDILDISAIEAGKLKHHPVDFELKPLVDSIQIMLQPTASAKQLRFTVTIANSVPNALFGDANHLRQILINLVANAIKFTEAGEVSLDVQNVSAPGGLRLQFQVKDTGIGIPLEAQQRIFDAFEQADQGLRRQYGGTGLGTTIARALTELAGGSIGFESKIGIGTTFTVILPFEPSNSAAPAEPTVPIGERPLAQVIPLNDAFRRHRTRVRPMRILIGDDQPSNIILLRTVLEKAGHVVRAVDDGEALLEAFAAEPYDAVIVDLHMPQVSGLEVIKQARVMDSGRVRTPIIVASADATAAAIEQCLKAGAYDFLSKPLVIDRLLQMLERIYVTHHPAEATTATTELSEQLIDETRLTSLQQQLGAARVKEILAAGCSDIEAVLAKLREAGDNKSWSGLRDQGIVLARLAPTVGASRLAQAADEFHASTAHHLSDHWRTKCDALQGQFELARAALIRRGYA